jgi:hypothetical protein
MAVPISLGDIYTAVCLAKEIYTFFAKAPNVEEAYTRYSRQIELLSQGLEDLWHILSEHQKQLERRGKRLGMMDLKVLAEIVGDFYGTLNKTKALLDKYSVSKSGRRGLITQINGLWMRRKRYKGSRRTVTSISRRSNLLSSP